MKVLYFLSAATLLLSMCSSAGGADEEAAAGTEELPEPEAQRRPYNAPYRPSSNNRFRGGGGGGNRDSYNSGGGGGGGSYSGVNLNPYDPSDVYKSMTTNLDNHNLDQNTLSSNAYNRAGYAGSSSSSSNSRDKYGEKYSSSSSSSSGSSSNSRDDYGYDDPTSKGGNYGGYSSASDYGGYGSESGGLSCASGYVNASAVALLAFLFLLNIVQDVIQSITNPRRRRDVEDTPSNDVFQFISDGGIDAMKEGLPQLMLPLMVELVEASEAPECLQRPLCRVNADLVMEYGTVGRVVGSLFSNVMAKAFTGDHVRHFHLALDAAKLGRNDGDCGAYPACTGPAHKYTSELNENRGHDSENGTEGAKKGDIKEGLENEVWSSHMELDNTIY